MKVLVLSDNYLYGGMETHIEAFIDNMQDVTFYLAATSIHDRVRESQRFKNMIQVNYEEGVLAELLEKIQRFIYKNNISHIHAHTYNTYWIAGVIAYRMGMGYTLTVHGPSTLEGLQGYLSDAVWTDVLRGANAVFVVSNELKDCLRLRGIETVYFPNSVDQHRYDLKEREKEEGKWILISRLHYDKIEGIKKGLGAVRYTSIKSIDIYGEGNAKEHLKNWIITEGMPYEVQFKGHSDVIDKVLNVNYEGVLAMGRAALESLAKGIPVLLLGYDGIKGMMDKNNFEQASYTNFSGRGLKTLTDGEVNQAIEDLRSNQSKYNLSDYMTEFTIEKRIKIYKENIEKQPTKFNLKTLNDQLLKEIGKTIEDLRLNLP